MYEENPGKNKAKWIILISILATVAIVAAIIFIPSHFEKVRDEAGEIAGMMTKNKNSFTIDTYPSENFMDSSMFMMQASRLRQQAHEAIKYANDELGFSSSLYDDMINTTALMGRQSEENDKYRVSWTYHPDEGLEVTYSKK